MTVPSKYANTYIEVKYFLSSYRALCDGRRGIEMLKNFIQSRNNFFLSDWKIIWIGTCSILRTAISLFEIDKKSCLDPRLRHEIAVEWDVISAEKEKHSIFWEFLRKERNNILKQYKWTAYKAWIKEDSTIHQEDISLLTLFQNDNMKPIILIESGPYKGRNSLELLKESADWVEARIFDIIRRAGFDPDEKRNIVNFSPRPELPAGQMGLLSRDVTPEP